MNIHLTRNKIKQMCGTVSFKRGDSFYRSNKVVMKSNNDSRCLAIVCGTEDFKVVIEANKHSEIKAACSCPKLASFQKDCQHVAAVLLYLFHHQQNTQNQTECIKDSSNHTSELTGDLFNIFDGKLAPSSGKQLHFENRNKLDVLFILRPFYLGTGEYIISFEICIGNTQIRNIREFLSDIHSSSRSKVSHSFTYDPVSHYFQHETNQILQELYLMTEDEKIKIESYRDDYLNREHLLISPTYWPKLVPYLVKTPFIKLYSNGEAIDSLQISNEMLPLNFNINFIDGSGYQLEVIGLNYLTILRSYHTIIFDGKLIELDSENIARLIELKRLIDNSERNQILIPNEQLESFLDKVVPGLKKIGHVHMSEEIEIHLKKAPLVAKLYLDRVKNRLLAGMEFNYGNTMFNPLEPQDSRFESFLIRDRESEARIIKIIEDSGFTKTEGGYYLHNEDLEYEFLYDIVPKLQKLVQIYATTAVRNRIFRKNPPPRIRVKVPKERTNWLEFKFELNGIPDIQIRELLEALEEKRKYYRLRNGSLLSLETREFKEIQRFLHSIPQQKGDLEYGLHIPMVSGIGLLETINESDFITKEESFQEFMQTILHPESVEVEIPKTVERYLRDYQKTGFKWMKTLARYRFGGILADDMGLGKTLQSITFILSELTDIRTKKLPVLVVCPSSLTYNWLNEIMKYAPELETLVIDGATKERMELIKELKNFDVIITSYPLLRIDSEWYSKQSFHTVIYDEAQSFKNPTTKTAKSVKKVKSIHRFALTGTPIENSLEELWSIFHVVFPELFLDLKEFSQLSKETISRTIQPFLLRRMKEDVLAELPQKIETIHSVELLSEQKKLYAAYLAKLRHDTLKHLDQDTFRKNRIKILAGLTRLRQICCHPSLFVEGYKGGSAKLEQLLQIIDSSRRSDRRVLIFSQYTKMLQIIGKQLFNQGVQYFYLDGQTPSEERVELCNQFNAGGCNYFLISLKAGGTGLNLTGAGTVILYDLWWNPAVEIQAADRAYRMGQNHDVEVIKLISKGTIEEKIHDLQDQKKQLIDQVIHSNEKNTTLTEDEIRQILFDR
ncbi:SNF2 helicase associated domain-containing protein [Bacillus salitolerans]|uniref:SNF2 helicase associated domain-containing protein n=1 Tax=Bacillus salitolerans TaxID=1437434 RepID=A0ABW4LRT6_9BACI